MNKKIKFISLILIISMIINILLVIIIPNKSYSSISADIEGINNTKYPGIKERIKLLQSKYPNWDFKILYTGIDWNQVISSEYTGHGSSPKNLVYKTSNYQGEWICAICGDRVYDSGNWRCASEQAIRYMMDPRNSLNASDVFQFEKIVNKESDINVLKSMTNGSFLSGHEQGIINAARNNNISAYFIAARLLQEQGKSGTVVTAGKGYKGQYVGYYNAFNIAASGNTTEQILLNELAYAKKKGWTTLDASIDGGISFLATQYVQKGQDTLYLQKFDVEATNGLYSNQYMQNILGAQNEGMTLRNAYITMNLMSSKHEFVIPVYENMPNEACRRPNENGTSSTDVDFVKVNVDTSLRIRNAPNGNTTIGWLYKDEIVTRIEKATSKIAGTYWDKVKKSDGTIGYSARETYDNEKEYKLYLVPINENNGGNNPGNNSENSSGSSSGKQPVNTSKLKVDENNKLLIVSPDAIAGDILEAFGGPTKITRADGSYLNGEQDLATTGFIVDDRYIVVKKGDCSGDGKVDSSDALMILQYSVGNLNMEEKFVKASKINNDEKIDSSDALQILQYSVGLQNIEI